MEQLKNLEVQKRNIENELDALFLYLSQDGMPGLAGPLVDEEGFPRNDIDIYGVREARHRIACLKTDYTRVMQDLEKCLHDFHSEHRSSLSSWKLSTAVGSRCDRAFAIVDKIYSGSPAESAGLRVGDVVLRFGSLSTENSTPTQCFQSLPATIEVGSSLEVCVLRDGEPLTLHLSPKTWGGKGLLGCHLKPTEFSET